MGWYKIHASLPTRAVLIGSLLGIGFIYPVLWWLGWGGVILFFWDLQRCHHTLRSAALLGGIGWLVKAALVLVWTWSVYPIDWLPISLGQWELLIIAIYWLTAALWLSVGGVAFGVIMHILSVRNWWIAPIAWLLAELLGAASFSLFTYGPGGQLSGALSFGFIGYLAAQHPVLLMVAQWGGVYVLSVLYVAIGYGGWLLVQKYHSRGVVGVGVVMVLVGATYYLSLFTAAPLADEWLAGATVAVIETDLPTGASTISDDVRRAQLTDAIQTAQAAGATHVLLPEDMRWLSASESIAQQHAFYRFAHNLTGIQIIDSGRRDVEGFGTVLRGIVLDTNTKQEFQVDKQYLVPQGEYIPTLHHLFLLRLAQPAITAALEKHISYRPGPLYSQSDWPTTTPRILFCYESVDPLGVRRLVQGQTVPFVVHPISHAWFHSPHILWQQLDTMLRVQAVWNQTTIISTGNLSPGKLYAPDGSILLPEYIAAGDWWRVGLFTASTTSVALE